MLDLYNDDFKFDDNQILIKKDKTIEFESNILYSYFDIDTKTINVVNLTEEINSAQDIPKLIENFYKYPFLSELTENLERINKDAIDFETTVKYLSVKNLFSIETYNITSISGNQGIGGTPWGINTADLTLSYISKNNIENLSTNLENKLYYFVNNIIPVLYNDKNKAFSLINKNNKDYLRQEKLGGEIILEDICEIENINNFKLFCEEQNIKVKTSHIYNNLLLMFHSILNNLETNENFSYEIVENNYKFILNKSELTIKYLLDIEDLKLFREFISKNTQLNNYFNKELKKIFKENKSNILIMDFPGVKNSFNLSKSHEIINKYKYVVENGKPIEKTFTCKVCSTNKEYGFSLRKFVLPSSEKIIQNFSLINNKEDGSGYICKECLDKVHYINEKLNQYYFIFVNRTSNEIVPLRNPRDIFKNNKKRIGGSLYLIEPINNGLKNFKFLFNLFSKDSSEDVLKRLDYISELLNSYKNESGTMFQDIFYFNNIDMKSIKEDDSKDFIFRARFVKTNFHQLLIFVLNNKKIPLHIFVYLLNNYMQNNLKLETGAYPLYGMMNERYDESTKIISLNNIDDIINFKIGGFNMLKDIVNSVNEKLNAFSEDKAANLNLTDEETVYISGKIIRELNSLSKSSSKDFGYVKNIIKSNKGIALFIRKSFERYSHEISNSRNTEIISIVLQNLDSLSLKKMDIETLLTAGILNYKLKVIFLENKTKGDK